MSTETPCIEEQVAELLENGWTQKKAHVWISPRGTWHIGPHGAWKTMKGIDVLSAAVKAVNDAR